MISSHPNKEDITKPFICHEYSPFFKPTLSFKKNEYVKHFNNIDKMRYLRTNNKNDR